MYFRPTFPAKKIGSPVKFGVWRILSFLQQTQKYEGKPICFVFRSLIRTLRLNASKSLPLGNKNK